MSCKVKAIMGYLRPCFQVKEKDRKVKKKMKLADHNPLTFSNSQFLIISLYFIFSITYRAQCNILVMITALF